MHTARRDGQRTKAPSANGTGGHAERSGPVVTAPPSTTVATVGPEGRGTDGRFTPGNRAAAGNAFHREVAARRKALLSAIGPEDVACVARALRDQALAGDVAAAKVLLLYVVGKPAEAADPDRLDLDELGLMLAQPFKAQLLAHMLRGVDPAVALAFLRQTTARREPSVATIYDGFEEGTYGMKELTMFLQETAKARAKQI